MLQLKLSYGTEKISCLMSRHYIQMIKIIDKGVGTKRVLTLFLIHGL